MTNIQFYSQYGEDRILSGIFRDKRDGLCVEVGGFDGVSGSNSYYFEKIGWKCLVVEPMPAFCEAIKKVRTCQLAETAVSDKEGEVVFNVVEGAETLSTIEGTPEHHERIKQEGKSVKKITVKTRRLDAVLSEHGIGGMDFISIDVEGHELSVLKGFSIEKFRPRIILLEDNFNGWDRQISRYLGQYGYIRFKRTGCNDWYARSDDKELFNRADLLITELKVCGIAFKSGAKKILKTVLPKSLIARLRAR